MDYEDVFYTTDDGRNAARPVMVDHRTGARVPVRAPTLIAAAPPAATTAVWRGPSPTYSVPQPTFFGNTVPQNAWGSFGYPLQPPYAIPQVAPPNNLSSILGGFGNVGSLANIIAQVFAALIPLPASPPIAESVEGDSARNAEINSGNLIKYQSALALFARRDQQILTLGSVLKELLKRPGLIG